MLPRAAPRCPRRPVPRIDEGEIESTPLPSLAGVDPNEGADLPLSLHRSERNNTSIRYGESYILKIFRRLEEGTNPDLEIGRYLTSRADYHGTAPVLGHIEYRRPNAEAATLAVLHRYIPNQGNAWQYTMDQLSPVLRARGGPHPGAASDSPAPGRPARIGGRMTREPGDCCDLIGGYLDTARLIGQRTAEMHRTLAENLADPAFAPEPFGKLYQRSIYQSMRNLTGRLCDRSVAHPATSFASRRSRWPIA